MPNIDIKCGCGYVFTVTLKSDRGVRCPKCRRKVKPNYLGSNIRINYDSDSLKMIKANYQIGYIKRK